MDYEIVNIKAKHTVGMVIKTTNECGKSIEDQSGLWARFLSPDGCFKIIGRKDNKTIGMYFDYEGDYTKPFKFSTCCEVESHDNITEGMVNLNLPEGKYAKFIINCNGDMAKEVGEFWGKLWNMKLERLYSYDFEEYQNNSEDINNQDIHVYISVK